MYSKYLRITSKHAHKQKCGAHVLLARLWCLCNVAQRKLGEGGRQGGANKEISVREELSQRRPEHQRIIAQLASQWARSL